MNVQNFILFKPGAKNDTDKQRLPLFVSSLIAVCFARGWHNATCCQ